MWSIGRKRPTFGTIGRSGRGMCGQSRTASFNGVGWQTSAVSRVSASVLPVTGRALPRVLGAVLGLILVSWGGPELGIVGGLGIAFLVFSVPTEPTKWWHYVRTGTRATQPLPAQFSERGVYRVELQRSGERYIYALKALREVTGVGLTDAKAMVEAVPIIVAEGLSAESADQVRERLESAGATAVVISDTH